MRIKPEKTRGKPEGKQDCVFIRIEDLLNNGFNTKLPVKVNRKWLESLGIQAISKIDLIKLEEVEDKVEDTKIEFSIQ